uniref:Uncharacterized protein n=1 Tax=blood disease bacterium R229 TaxID=741978 RepID=G2ZWI0_9RALS|nr:exported hypothetical protein [blood disease bacterium R229]
MARSEKRLGSGIFLGVVANASDLTRPRGRSRRQIDAGCVGIDRAAAAAQRIDHPAMGVCLRRGRIAIHPVNAGVIEHHDAGQVLKATRAVGPQATSIEAGKTAALRVPGQEYVLASGFLLNQRQHMVDVTGIGFKVPIRDKRQIALFKRTPGRTGSACQRLWRSQREFTSTIQREAAVTTHGESTKIVFNRLFGVSTQYCNAGTGCISQVCSPALDNPHLHPAIHRAQAIPAPAFSQVRLVQQLGTEIEPVCRGTGKSGHCQNDGMRLPGMLTIQCRAHAQEGSLVQIGRGTQDMRIIIPTTWDLDIFSNDVRIFRQTSPFI